MLKNRIENVDVKYYDSTEGICFTNIDDSASKELEEISEEFAVLFSEWIAINDYRRYSNGWSKVWKKGALTSKELLEIYKKQKAL